MEPLNQSDVMHLQDPLPTALDLSMGCKGNRLKQSPVEALDLVKKPSWYGLNPGSDSRTSLPENRSDCLIPQPCKQATPDMPYTDQALSYPYGSRSCVLPPHNPQSFQLPTFNGLPNVAQILSQCSAADQLIMGDDTCPKMDQNFTQHPSTQLSSRSRTSGFAHQEVELGPESSPTCMEAKLGTASTHNGMDCTWNGTDSDELEITGNSSSGAYLTDAVTAVEVSKGSVPFQDLNSYSGSTVEYSSPTECQVSETTQCHETVKRTTHLLTTDSLEESSEAKPSLVPEQTDVITLMPECAGTGTGVNSSSSVQFISDSDDSDVIEVPVSNPICKKQSSSPDSKSNQGPVSQTRDSQVSETNHESKASLSGKQCVDLETDAMDCTSVVNESSTSPLATSDFDSKTQDVGYSLNAEAVAMTLPSTSDAKNPSIIKSPQSGASTTPSNHSSCTDGPQTTPTSRRKKRTKPRPKQKSPAKQMGASPGSKCTTKAAKRRRKKPQPSGSSSVFSPQEPEIKLKYANYKEEKRETRADGFAPYVRMELREFSACTVVNFQEDDDDFRIKKGSHQATTGPVSGLVPKTSCFQLGRLSSGSKAQSIQLCCLCGRSANMTNLGDLHGPYYPVGSVHPANKALRNPSAQRPDQDCSDQDSVCSAEDRKDGHLKGQCEGLHLETAQDSSGIPDNDYESPNTNSAKRPRRVCSSDDWHGVSQETADPKECWVHEDCSIWSTGVFLVKGKLYGLQEAVRLAQGIVCSTCQRAGATLGCFFKGCPNKYHFPCAVQSGCMLNDENFTIRCPKHKNKSARVSANRLNSR
ncbi:uncharacterized protein LOC115826386 [Chanos chanos]|uniref:Uncharacterized protein LOC115826386 n=1 Tax=Chanos chanos TaxID=29144 RepID=A0A6J2WP44_CHACN|nr:uncharacterized protein LOC115826386 [Chanos chanos]XP_030646064.1 uncharacterized protein LOC115826386 [Chanos chanos]